MALLLSEDLLGAVEFAKVYEKRAEAFARHYRACAQLTREELKARDRGLRRDIYQQVIDWHEAGIDAVERARIAVQEIDDEVDASNHGGDGGVPVPTPEPARPQEPWASQVATKLDAPCQPCKTLRRAKSLPPRINVSEPLLH